MCPPRWAPASSSFCRPFGAPPLQTHREKALPKRGLGDATPSPRGAVPPGSPSHGFARFHPLRPGMKQGGPPTGTFLEDGGPDPPLGAENRVHKGAKQKGNLRRGGGPCPVRPRNGSKGRVASDVGDRKGCGKPSPGPPALLMELHVPRPPTVASQAPLCPGDLCQAASTCRTS